MSQGRLRGKLDYIVVVDIEATCWDGPIPSGQENEIIEIGLCLFEIASRQRMGKRSILVWPERSAISPFCTRLTTITQEMVDEQGIAFADACAVLRDEYASKDRVWASYGNYDRQMFEHQCQASGVEYPFGARHLNIKTLFAIKKALPNEYGMARALDVAGLDLEGIHHRGHDDAWNIAALLANVFSRS